MSRPVLDGASLGLEPGERVALLEAGWPKPSTATSGPSGFCGRARPRERAMLERLGDELDHANARVVDELHSSRSRIVATADRERRRLERDLHDGAQQRLMAIQVKLRLAQAHVAARGPSRRPSTSASWRPSRRDQARGQPGSRRRDPEP